MKLMFVSTNKEASVMETVIESNFIRQLKDIIVKEGL